MTFSLPDARPEPHGPRVADLQLRGHTGPLRTRVHWPPAPGAPVVRPLLVVLAAADPEVPWAAVSALAGVIVLAVGDAPVAGASDAAALAEAETAVHWAADHADELHADPTLLLLGGEGAGAWRAAEVALAARDDGWPSLVRQLLVVTATSGPAAGAARTAGARRERSPVGVAPAIVATIGDGPHVAEARGYAARLRDAGVHVDELHHDGPAGDVAAWVAAALRRALGGGEGPA